jgi:hypothetical protein
MVSSIVEYRDQNLPGVEVWITEFGWDSGIKSTAYSCPSIADYSREEVQAQWIVRSFLLLSSTGIDRAAQFMLRNVRNNGSIQFETCGLVNEKDDWSPKTSWYYTYTMKNLLKGKYFSGEQPSGNTNVMIYKYENAGRDTVVYAVWAPTSDGTILEGYELELEASVQSAWGVELTDGSVWGRTHELTWVSDKVALQVSEKPIFIIASMNPVTARHEVAAWVTLKVYPNPVKDKLNLDLSKLPAAGKYRIRILSMDGRTVFQDQLLPETDGRVWQTEFSGFTTGVYFMEVSAPDRFLVQKIVKSR